MDILLSTSNDRILNVKMLIKSIDFNQCKLLIGHQVTTELSLESQDMVDELEDNPNVSYFSLSSTGVTKSRNYLIKTESIVFCDDDIQYVQIVYIRLNRSWNVNI